MAMPRPPVVLLLLLAASLLAIPAAAVSLVCVDGATSCSSHGQCVPDLSDACMCDAGFLGADCSIVSTAVIPVRVDEWRSILGMRIRHEFRVLPPNATGTSTLHVRWTVDTDTWFGVILDVDVDGMSPLRTDGESGDSWNFFVTSGASPRRVYLGDAFSQGTDEPAEDAEQDLTVVAAWNDGAGTQSIEFTRPFNTGHANDMIFPEQPGKKVRFMWTTGLTAPAGATTSSSYGRGGGGGGGGGRPKVLSMHGYLGYTGQYRVDFAAQQFEVLQSGVKWPNAYWSALAWVGAVVLAGMLLSIASVQRSGTGRCMRTRPLLGLRRVNPKNVAAAAAAAAPADEYRGAHDPPPKPAPLHFARSVSDARVHRWTLQVWPAFRTLSWQELAFLTVYAGFVAAAIASSAAAYVNEGKSVSYVLGHLSALHLALLLLPVARNSVWLALLGTSFDRALAWHRRMGVLAVLFTITHFISQLILWDAAVIVYTSGCQFGMAPLFGTLALLAFLALAGFSLEYVRRAHYELFLRMHVVLAVIGFCFALLHSIQFRWMLLGPGALLLIDFALRFVWHPWIRFGGRAAMAAQHRSHNLEGVEAVEAPSSSKQHRTQRDNHHARVVQLSVSGHDSDPPSLHDRVVSLTVSVPRSVGESFQPADFVMLCFPAVSPLEVHPYTVSSIQPCSDRERMLFTVHIQAVARHQVGKRQLVKQVSKLAPVEHDADNELTWSEQVFELAKKAIGGENDVLCLADGGGNAPAAANEMDAAERGDCTRAQPSASAAAADVSSLLALSPILDGPYRSVFTRLPLWQFPVLVLVAGGIGVTPLISIVNECVRRVQRQEEKDQQRVRSDDVPLPSTVVLLWTARSASAFGRWFPRELAAAAQCARVQLLLHSTHPLFESDLQAAGLHPAASETAAQIQQPRIRQSPPPGDDAAPITIPAAAAAAADGHLSSNDGLHLPSLRSGSGAIDAPAAAVAVAPRSRIISPRSGGEQQQQQQQQLVELRPLHRAAAVAAAGAPDGQVLTHVVNVASAAASSSPRSSAVAAPTAPMCDVSRPSGSPFSSRGQPASLRVAAGRPDLSALLDAVIASRQAVRRDRSPGRTDTSLETAAAASDVLLLACGPRLLVEDAEAEAQLRGCQFAHEQFEY